MSGTYSADAIEGKAPFVAITFLDSNHYSYVSSSSKCLPQDDAELGDDDDAGTKTTTESDGGTATSSVLGDDPADPVADNGATPDYDADPTDNGCIHNGTYTLSQTTVTLTDDGASSSISLDLGQIDPDGSEVADPNASAAVADGGNLFGQSLDVGGSLKPQDSLYTTGGTLFGQASVSQFSAGGTKMRRTGLSSTSTSSRGICRIGTTEGTCTTTSSCSAAGKVSTANYCPGPSSIQCCTDSAPASGGDDDSSGDDTGGGLVTSGKVATAMEWVNVKMPYCQAANGGREVDVSCYRVHGRTCNRTGSANNANWNKYRSDCSGLVSFAWGLRAPGLTTEGFVPGAAKYIPTQDLQPGDALLRSGHHIVLFDYWVNKSAGQAKVIAEPGCDAKGGPYAQVQSWSMGRAPGAGSSAHWSGATYYAIRQR